MPLDKPPHMKITAVEVFLLNFPVKAVFVLAGGVAATPGSPSPRVLVKVSTDAGVAGWGEATPTPRWTYETSETIVTTLRRYVAPAVIGLEAWDLDSVHRAMERAINPGVTMGSPLAKSAVDVAIHDALGRARGVPVYALLGRRRRTQFDLTWMITTQNPGEAPDMARKGLDAGHRRVRRPVASDLRGAPDPPAGRDPTARVGCRDPLRGCPQRSGFALLRARLRSHRA